ncbi:Degradation activator [Limihaloglobus sulfuriphilus]|uniref:Degradation activator n=1 Tax=Limihaloglobus sulfuriphilus TaxID=1851148 RepID=A0A1Q2MBC6_9BACT|nr:LacI family DNA-binding transcriptional regulator [Limihaloglobus sulfuriphilus]AQQ70023.1 Degradation activator [Limihaloglobus sulfuriphilus]
MKKNVYNLSDVAKEAGVSKSTVSRILNNRFGHNFSVKKEVHERVLEVAQRLNYQPSLIAKSLSMKSTRMIHVFGGNPALAELGNIYQTILNNFTDEIDSLNEGFDVTMDMSRHLKGESEMPAWRIDGAAILARYSQHTMDTIKQMGIPYVMINGMCDEGGFAVVPDDIGGTRLAVEHLVGLGHRKIAYSGPIPPGSSELEEKTNEQNGTQEYKSLGLEVNVLTTHPSLTDRYNTYLSELEKYGLEPIIRSHYEVDSPQEYLEETINKHGATAILAYGHMGALNIMQTAHAMGLAIPEDFSLMCFCDAYANRVMSPRITFIDLQTAQMGRIAAKLLVEQIHSHRQTKPEKIVLPEQLVVNETTAPPA